MARIARTLVLVGLLCCMGVAVHARKGSVTKGSLAFPSLDSCLQKPDSTPFRPAANITKGSLPSSNTWCFGFASAAPANPTASCGMATKLERVQIWAPYANRTSITSIRIRDTESEKTVFGAWIKKGASFVDELVVSKLDWAPEYIAAKNPRICLTLKAAVDLDTICLGPQGRCTVALYSSGSSTKCCPVYTLQVPAV